MQALSSLHVDTLFEGFYMPNELRKQIKRMGRGEGG